MRLGTVAGARAALAGDLTYVGEGCFRVVYVDYETDTVYKVEYDDGIYECANLIEIEAYANRHNLPLPKGYKIVPMRLIVADATNVIAARFIRGTRMGDCYCTKPERDKAGHSDGCISHEDSHVLASAGIDGSWGNIIDDGTTRWIVDAQ